MRPRFFVPVPAEQGYAWVNRNAYICARIDRPDWRAVLDRSGVQIEAMAQAEAADVYRRWFSEDRLRLPRFDKAIPNSTSAAAITHYAPKVTRWPEAPAALCVDTWEGSDAFPGNT